jgi:CheY-like chemotaxis protein
MYPASPIAENNMVVDPSNGRLSGEGKLRHNGNRKTSPSGNTPLEEIRVVIADDHPVARQGLSAILGSLDDVKVAAEAVDGEEACQLYYQYSSDVLIVDLRMPKKDRLQVVDELMSGGPPKPRIIVITTYEEEEDIRRAVKAGAKGYLVKVADGEQIERSGSRSCRWPQPVPDDHHSEAGGSGGALGA